MNPNNNRPKILIVGGGLVGSLNALFFAQTEKFDIILCEKTSDIRVKNRVIGRSINLSLSHRGLCALKIVGLENEILQSSIPMYARMIHEKNGNLKQFTYGKSHQYISAVDRKLMVEVLLTKAEQNKFIQLRFNTKLVDVNFEKKTAKFDIGEKFIEIEFDLLIGNDGAYSVVRQFMMKNMRMNFSQDYISHGYIELYFPPKEDGKYSMTKNCLHIWPRHEYMLIALPNNDGSFTGTLFMPFSMFESIQSNDDLLKLFEDNFPDALKLMDRSTLEKLFFANKPAKMVTIRCSPYNFGRSCVIMGDAAHAMVPFYGQGMNCGFEDIIIFHKILKANDFDLGKTCSDFSENRNRDAKAICELAFYNYLELRRNVTMTSFRLRKAFDNLMNSIFPSFWIPLYTMVCFTRIPYTKCLEEKHKQDKILATLKMFAYGFSFGGVLIGVNYLIQCNNYLK